MPRTSKKKFDIYNKPRRPKKPLATLPNSSPSAYIEVQNQSRTTLTEDVLLALQDATEISIIDHYYDDDYGGLDVTLAVYTQHELPNPKYDEQMERYRELYAQYKTDLKWWNEEKKKYDEKRKAEQEKQERETLAKLLQKYGPEVAEDAST